ncbi:MAG: phosphoribosylaminoimidazolesuccinocarboxamide synthase [Oscillospiraceae bacterium]|jgi:phosphoribosylaminoimidazole-succinocarboxamide synthase|nr:phosphoribosylaminoimidazolesuccinocarboxamide synthase [Oscillospiraceae bacterium]
MKKLDMLYEGKAKKIYKTGDPEVLIVEYKDDATAFNGEKRGAISGKGVINNRMTNYFMRLLEGCGIPTHYIEELSDRETAVKRVDIVPLEVIVRNISAGSFAKRYGVKEGIVFKNPTVEFSYKDDALGDPLLNTSHALALGLAAPEDIALIREYVTQINHFLKSELSECDVTLVDFKVEFGKLTGGKIVLADEISPDTCRFWDTKTGEKLDKDRFRQDLGNVEGAYAEIARRLGITV